MGLAAESEARLRNPPAHVDTEPGGDIRIGCNYWFLRGFRTIGRLSYLTVYQGPPCSSSTVLGVSIQVSEDRDFTDHSEDRFETMPLVLETIPPDPSDGPRFCGDSWPRDTRSIILNR